MVYQVSEKKTFKANVPNPDPDQNKMDPRA